MMRSLYSGVSGLKTHQTKMDVIGNNISNVNTLAFKSSSVTFSEIMYQTTQNASGPNAARGTGGINAKQIGLGVTLGTTSTNIEGAGATQTTGRGLDVKIKGDSFFVVNDGSNNYFTRAGSFYFDGSGNLAMTSTGFNVMGWQVNPQTGEIQKDNVSALRIMQAQNLTSPPEATTNATCSGVLDSNSKQVASEEGYPMSLSIYDSLGYQYMAKFSVTEDASGGKGQYNVTLTDITDANGKSVLGDVDKTALFGAAYPGKIGKGTLLSGYKMEAATHAIAGPGTPPEVTVHTLKNAAGQVVRGSEIYVGADGKYLALNGNTPPDGFIALSSTAEADQPLIKAEEKRLQEIFGKYFTGSAGNVYINGDSTFKNTTVFNHMLTAGGQSLTVADGYKCNQVAAGPPAQYQFLDSATGNAVTPASDFYIDAAGKFVGADGTTPLTPAELDALEVTLKKYTTGASESFALDPASTFADQGQIMSGNTKVDVTGTKYYQTLNFDPGDGTFKNVGGGDAVTLALSNLGGNFKNVSVDFTQVSNFNNGGTPTIGMDPGGLDGTTGSGKKLGAMNSVSIDTDGKIFASYDNGNTALLGQIAVAAFANASGLEKIGDNCYKTTLNSGEFDGVGQDITADSGSMTTGALEMSNVDLSSEFTEMITTQRGFQANSRIITTSDTLLEELINLKR